MTRKNLQLAFLSMIAVILLVMAYFEFVLMRSKYNPILEVGEVDRLEIRIQNHTVELERKLGSVMIEDGKLEWSAMTLDGERLSDARANSNLINHIVSITKNLKDISAKTLNASEAASYGVASPMLAVSMEWNKPTPGAEVAMFGNRDLSGRTVYAFFPKKMLLAQTSSNVLEVIKGKTAFDLLSRNISTFESDDDVNELEISGMGCTGRHFMREGEKMNWVKGSPFPTEKDENKIYDETRKWLSKFLSNSYGSTVEISDFSKLKPVCQITLKGLSGRVETLEVFNSRNHGYVLKNLTLSSQKYFTVSNKFF